MRLVVGGGGLHREPMTAGREPRRDEEAAVGTGIVVIVVAVAVVLVVLLVTVSMRGRQMRGAQRRGEPRRDGLDEARGRQERQRDRDIARERGEDVGPER